MKSLTAVIRKGDKFYVGECLEIDVVTQGKTVDETIKNLKEAISLYFEGEDKKGVSLPEEPPIVVPLEIK